MGRAGGFTYPRCRDFGPDFELTMDYARFIASDGTELAYGLTGAETAPVVVLCHGICAGAAQFTDDAAYFAKEGFRVLAPDLRGHGLSGRPEKIAPAGFSPQRLIADMIEMLDQLGVERVHWVGNSLGGMIGLGLAETRPERLASLAIFGTALSLSLPRWIGKLVPLSDIVPGRRATAALMARSTTRERSARPLIGALLRRFHADSVAAILSHIHHFDLTPAATGWTGPGLVLVGERDFSFNLALKRQLPIVSKQPNWHVVPLPKGGHCANLDAGPGWRQALLTFWSATATP